MELEHYERFDLAAPDDNEEGAAPKPLTITETDGKRTLIGYAVVWGAISDLRRDGFRHQFVRGSIKWADTTFALWAHDIKTPLAVTSNGTLRITEDDYGVRVEIDLDQTSDGQNAYIRVHSELVTGMSFGGSRHPQDFRRTSDPTVIQPFNFSAVEVTLTITPAIRETKITTAEKSQKDKATPLTKNKLNTFRLALLRP